MHCRNSIYQFVFKAFRNFINFITQFIGSIQNLQNFNHVSQLLHNGFKILRIIHLEQTLNKFVVRFHYKAA